MIAWFTADGADRHRWHGCVPVTHRLWREHRAGRCGDGGADPAGFIGLVYDIVMERWVLSPSEDENDRASVARRSAGVRMRTVNGVDGAHLIFVYATEAYLAAHPDNVAALEYAVRTALLCATA